MHVFEDLVHVEVVDDDGRAVPDGSPGSRILVTNLLNRTQPLIRFELTDLVTVSPEPCPCGRPFKVLADASTAGPTTCSRSPRAAAGPSASTRSSCAARWRRSTDVRQYKIVHDDDGLHVEAVLAPRRRRPRRCEEVARAAARRARRGRRGRDARVDVAAVGAIERHAGSGKAKVIESRVGKRAAARRAGR